MKNNKLKLVLFLTVFIDVIGFGIIIPLLPFYGENFGASPAIITLLFSCYSLMQFLFAPLWGSLSDRMGRRPILLLSIGGSCLSYLWCGLANSLWMLFASRLLAGFMGGTIVTAQAYISDITTPDNRAKGMGMIGASLGLGFTLGPAIGGFLAGNNPEEVNYQLPLLAASGLSLCGLIFAFLALPKSGKLNPDEEIKKVSVSKRLSGIIETLQSPLINVVIGIFFIISIGLLGAQTTLALWLERQFSWGPQQTGYLLMFCGVLATIFQGGMIGILNKKFGEVNLLLSGLCILGMGLFLLPFSTSLLLLLGAMFFLTIGESLCKTSIRSLLSQLVKANETGKILGIAQSAGSLGTIIGPTVAGFAFVTMGKDSPFLNGAILMLIATILCLSIIKKIRSELRTQG
ncbi:MAG: MFS transporter [Nostocaceae cyanobacterium]|nr:MFS transporter [Nostocaceae cyanobacterium]